MRATVLLALVLFVVPTLARASDREQPAVDITGTYLCQGQSPNGTPYRGIVKIVKIDDTFRIRWTLGGDGGGDQVNLVGVGIYSNGVFAVSYFGGAPGVGVYKIDGTRLVGEWTIGGADGAVYTEMLTRLEHQPNDDDTPDATPGATPSHHANPAAFIKVKFDY